MFPLVRACSLSCRPGSLEGCSVAIQARFPVYKPEDMFGEGWLLGGTRPLNVLSQEVTSLGSRLERELVAAMGQVG